MLPIIPDESAFQPNPNERHPQPILQDDADVPQEARNCLNAMLKSNFQSIVSKSSTDIGRSSSHNSDKIVSYYPFPNISDLLARLGNCKIS